MSSVVKLACSLFILTFCSATRYTPISSLTSSNPYQVLHNNLNLNKSYPLQEENLLLDVSKNIKEFKLVPDNNSVCFNQIFDIIENSTMKYTEDLQTLDSWGKLPSGIFQGNLKFFGRFKECHSTGNQYCLSYIGYLKEKLQDVFNSLQVGTCVPKACSKEDLTSFFNKTLASKGLFAYFQCDKVGFQDWSSVEIFTLYLLLTIILVVILSSLFDCLHRRKTASAYEKIGETKELKLVTPNADCSRTTKFLTSFSLIRNVEELFKINDKPDQFRCLNGMRFFSMCWVMIGHLILFLIGLIDNPLFLIDITKDSILSQIVVNATFSVDTFFFMSGLLVSYILLKKIQTSGRTINPLKIYLLRYLRLTPLYGFCLLLGSTLWLKLGEGPMFFQIFGYFRTTCNKYWWTNILYVNNLYPSDTLQQKGQQEKCECK